MNGLPLLDLLNPFSREAKMLSDKTIVSFLDITDRLKGSALNAVYEMTKEVYPLMVEGVESGEPRYDAAIERASNHPMEMSVEELVDTLDTLDVTIDLLSRHMKLALETALVKKDPLVAVKRLIEATIALRSER